MEQVRGVLNLRSMRDKKVDCSIYGQVDSEASVRPSTDGNDRSAVPTNGDSIS